MCDGVVDQWKNVGSNGKIVIPVVAGMNWSASHISYHSHKPAGLPTSVAWI